MIVLSILLILISLASIRMTLYYFEVLMEKVRTVRGMLRRGYNPADIILYARYDNLTEEEKDEKKRDEYRKILFTERQHITVFGCMMVFFFCCSILGSMASGYIILIME